MLKQPWEFPRTHNACMIGRCSHVWLFATLWSVAHKAPLSWGFSRQEYWSRLWCPPPGNVPNPGIELLSCMPPPSAGRFCFVFFYLYSYLGRPRTHKVKLKCQKFSGTTIYPGIRNINLLHLLDPTYLSHDLDFEWFEKSNLKKTVESAK